jgi:hypothetical protein
MPMKDYILNNLTWKLLSLFLAVLIWSVIKNKMPRKEDGAAVRRTEVTTVSEFSYPALPVQVIVSPGTPPRQFELDPETVSVRLQGDDEVLRALLQEEVSVWVDVSEFEGEGPKRLPVRHVAPDTVTVIEVDPPDVRVWLRRPGAIPFTPPPDAGADSDDETEPEPESEPESEPEGT